MKPSLYLETTIPSVLTARPTNSLRNSYQQSITREWWDTKRNDFSLFASIYTWRECERGDPEAAKRRLEVLKNISLYPTSKKVEDLSLEYIKLLSIPEKSWVDAFHLATCVVHQIDYLLSWNCTHLGSASSDKVSFYNHQHGLFVPILTTPEIFIKTGGAKDELP